MSGILSSFLRVVGAVATSLGVVKDVPVPSLEAAFRDRYIIPDEHFHALGKPVSHYEFDVEQTYNKQVRIDLHSNTRYAGRIHPYAIPFLEQLLTSHGYKYRIRYIKDLEDSSSSGWYVDVCDPVHLDVSATMYPSVYVYNLVRYLNELVYAGYR
jgi:hypothetical protein